MAKYFLTQKAVADLNNIWNYTFESWSESLADEYYNMLLDSCQVIADYPSLGKQYEYIEGGLKGWRAGRHILFYRPIEEDSIEIIRILHEQMDLAGRMEE